MSEEALLVEVRDEIVSREYEVDTEIDLGPEWAEEICPTHTGWKPVPPTPAGSRCHPR